VLGLDECYVVHDENAWLANSRQLFDSALRRFHAVIASVERPGAAKDAVPRATSAEFNGSGRVELADEIFPAMSRQMASRQQIIERLDERWRRTAVIRCHAAGNLFQVAPILCDRIQQPGDGRFAFSGQHAIHSTLGMPQNFLGNK
jgi:hypothetical protein